MTDCAESIDRARAFRVLLEATSHPGKVLALPPAIDVPAPLHVTAAAICLVLCDYDTPLWLAPSLGIRPVVDYLRFHTGAPITGDTGSARFLICDPAAAAEALREAERGSAEYPDRSATLLVQVPAFARGLALSLTGPGIKNEQKFTAAELDRTFWAALQRNHRLFPLGCDFIFASPGEVAALPRSTQVAIEGHS
ncbi:MAG: phosphonate C-P lyase system protein PhnH [Pseudomonadota bacterium]|nr:phosphonate C-P lyase system protein PhnH [Pseudomonadota bacterium]